MPNTVTYPKMRAAYLARTGKEFLGGYQEYIACWRATAINRNRGRNMTGPVLEQRVQDCLDKMMAWESSYRASGSPL